MAGLRPDSPRPTAVTLHQASQRLELAFDDGAVFSIIRRARADLTINGELVPQGAPVFCMLHSANRDPRVNRLSLARMFLFGARDVWFVVALPVFLQRDGRVALERVQGHGEVTKTHGAVLQKGNFHILKTINPFRAAALLSLTRASVFRRKTMPAGGTIPHTSVRTRRHS